MNVKEEQEIEKSESTAPETLIFVHRFSPTVTATIRVIDQPPAPSPIGLPVPFRHDIYWTERPARTTAKAYRRWILSVHRTLADRWNTVIAYGLMLKTTEMEIWRFEPREKPVLHALIRMED